MIKREHPLLTEYAEFGGVFLDIFFFKKWDLLLRFYIDLFVGFVI